MLRAILSASLAALLLVVSCGDEDGKKRAMMPEAGAGGDDGAGGAPSGTAEGGSMSDAGMPAIPSEGGHAGQIGEAGMPGQAGVSGQGPEPLVLDVGANRGGGRVAVGYHTCVVVASGAVYCAGDNTYGALGHPATSGTAINSTLLPTAGPGGVGAFTDAELVSVGEGFSCAKAGDGSVWCWGDNLYGQIGDDDQTQFQANSPVQVLDADSDLGAGGAGPGPLQGITALAAGTLHSCALGADAFVRCWGYNQFGQVGVGIFLNDIPIASRVELPNVAEVGAGNGHTCARTSGVTAAAQTVYCWGRGTELGQDADIDDKATPVQVLDESGTSFINDVVSLAVGGSHSCAAKSDGTVWCWGMNEVGQCGTGTFGEVGVALTLPVQVQLPGDLGPLDDVVALFAGDDNTCALSSQADVWCWGGNYEGQLGIDSVNNQPAAVQIPGLKASKLSLGGYHSCAIDVAGQAVWCWGNNLNGQLGTADTQPALVPQPLPLP